MRREQQQAGTRQDGGYVIAQTVGSQLSAAVERSHPYVEVRLERAGAPLCIGGPCSSTYNEVSPTIAEENGYYLLCSIGAESRCHHQVGVGAGARVISSVIVVSLHV